MNRTRYPRRILTHTGLVVGWSIVWAFVGWFVWAWVMTF